MAPDDNTKKPLVSFREAFELYEHGKHRRYELLFAVNGGAFAIGKLIGENKLNVGKLHVQEVAIGLILFTFLMVFDIYTFGLKWHAIAEEITLPEEIKKDKKSEESKQYKKYEIFGWKGQVVLVSIGLLLCVGWALAARQS